MRKPLAAIFLNPMESNRWPGEWAADVLEHLFGGHDVTICPVRGRDAFLQIPWRYYWER